MSRDLSFKMQHLSRKALLLIDNQSGCLEPASYWGTTRSNPAYENNITKLLSTFRDMPGSPLIVHVAHRSTSTESPLHPTKPGYEFLPFVTPLPEETIITKEVNSAFIGTCLEQILRDREINELYVAGLVTDHCVSTTTRMAANLHVTQHQHLNEPDRNGRVILIEDATAAWQKHGSNFDAETVHRVNVESLQEFAEIKKTAQVMEEILQL